MRRPLWRAEHHREQADRFGLDAVAPDLLGADADQVGDVARTCAGAQEAGDAAHAPQAVEILGVGELELLASERGGQAQRGLEAEGANDDVVGLDGFGDVEPGAAEDREQAQRRGGADRGADVVEEVRLYGCGSLVIG